MAFGVSAYLTTMHEPVSKAAVSSELGKLLGILGQNNPDLVEELSAREYRQNELATLSLWNRRITSNPQRDAIGVAAARFWAAQTLATTVLGPSALDSNAFHSPGIVHAMEAGADALFDVGQGQFLKLKQVAHRLVSWIASRGHNSFSIIACPLGNSLPVQVVCDAASLQGISGQIVEWNAPRNDRPSWGRTLNESATELAANLPAEGYVIYMDDAITGTRFVKLFDAIAKQVEPDRLLAIGLRFIDTLQPSTSTNPNRKRMLKRLYQHEKRIGFENSLIDFPPQRLFKIDAGPHCRWESPTMWGDSDLIAGKRKVNLIFTLLNHCCGILRDLGSDNSKYRTVLATVWSRDTSGATYLWAPGLSQSVFSALVKDLEFEDFLATLWAQAKSRFPDDYNGQPFSPHEEGARERWFWFRESFLAEAKARLDEQQASLAWRAIDNVFAASFLQNRPRAARDDDAAPFTFRFNATISALNLRLRQRILG